MNTFEKRDDPTTTASVALDVEFNERHDAELLLNPFESRDNGQFSEPVMFQGETFPANNNVESAWRMTDLRGRWAYNLTPSSPFDLRLGAGLAASFITVELASLVESDTLFAKQDDIALLPYGHLTLGYQVSENLKIEAITDATKIGGDTLIDANLALLWRFDDFWTAGIAYGYYNRDIETKDLTNHVVYNGISVGMARSF